MRFVGFVACGLLLSSAIARAQHVMENLGRGDRPYRVAIACQNVGHNQPPHAGFFLGDVMQAPPRPRIDVPTRRP